MMYIMYIMYICVSLYCNIVSMQYRVNTIQSPNNKVQEKYRRQNEKLENDEARTAEGIHLVCVGIYEFCK